MTNNIVRISGDDPIRSSSTTRLMKNGFNPLLFWGRLHHVIPRIEASGRWENLPVCKHPGVGYETSNYSSSTSSSVKVDVVENKKQHKLIACLWASASFTTRGNAQAVSDTSKRLMEWIEFHLLVGFDHIYVYDNSGANTNETSLEPIIFPRFRDTEVTRIDWPTQCCNVSMIPLYMFAYVHSRRIHLTENFAIRTISLLMRIQVSDLANTLLRTRVEHGTDHTRNGCQHSIQTST